MVGIGNNDHRFPFISEVNQQIEIHSFTQPLHGTVVETTQNRLKYTSPDGFQGKTSFTYQVTDTESGNNDSATVFVNVSYALTNARPIAIDDIGATSEESSIGIFVMGNDSDPAGDYLGIETFTQGQNGRVTQTTDNLLTYTPNENFFGSDSFTYALTDGRREDTGLVTITVSPQPDDPTAENDIVATPVGTTIQFDVLANDSDPDGNELTATIVSGTLNGSIFSHSNGLFTYTPNPGFVGTDSFIYVIEDGTGRSDTASVSININEGTNQFPIPLPDTVTLVEDNEIVIDVLANDVDINNDLLGIVSFTQPANGRVVQEENNLRYMPNPNFDGSDVFSYTVSDGEFSNEADVTIEMTPVDDTPRAMNDVVGVNINGQIKIQIFDNDTDGDQERLKFIDGGIPQRGDLQLALDHFDQRIPYRIPNPEWSGIAYLDFERGWWPNWEKSKKRYHTASKNLVRTAHPLWTEDQIEEQAKIEFEAGARILFEEGLTHIKQMRPNAILGYYYIPYKDYGCNEPHCPNGAGVSTDIKELHDAIPWYWEWLRDNNGFMNPSLYMNFKSSVGENTEARNIDFITQMIEEAKRLSNQFGNIPVLPYVWWQYHNNSSYTDQPLEPTDAYIQFILPGLVGADGLLHFGGISGVDEDLRRDYYTNTLIPLLNDNRESTNRPPVARDDQVKVNSKEVTIDVLINDFDPDFVIGCYDEFTDFNDGLTIDPGSLKQPRFGSTIIFDNKVIYRPNPGYSGEDYFNYRATDGLGLSNEATVTANVNGLFSTPVYDRRTERVLRGSTGGSLSIPYSVEEQSNVNITIYTRNGEIVKELEVGDSLPGNHLTTWDGRNELGQKVASGTYIYALRVEGQPEKRVKIVVIR